MRWMRPTLFLSIQMAKHYRKKKNLPDHFEKLDDEWVKKAITEQDKWDQDCLTLDQKQTKGVQIEKAELPNCKAWLMTSDKNPSALSALTRWETVRTAIAGCWSAMIQRRSS